MVSHEVNTFDPANDGYASQKTVYEYGNEEHLYPTTVTELRSTGSTRTRRIFYPQDVSYASQDAAQESAREKLIGANRLHTVLKHTVSAGSDTWTEQMRYALFSGMVLPRSLTTGYNGRWQEQQVCTRYTSRGRLSEFIDKDGMTTTILWSYENQYPIAVIKNETYANVLSLTGGVAASIEDSRPLAGQLETINRLRDQLPHAQVTTYTYAPFIGMTSMTDPRGVTTYYTYDSAGRLKEIYTREDDVKTVQESYNYHYLNP